MPEVRILIVEDNRIVAEDIKFSLEELGYQVCGIATSGEKALEFVKDTIPDLAIMDIRLGKGMNGIETATLFNRIYSIPVIYLTAHADEETLERAKLTEPFGYLVKPFEVEELKSAVEIAIYKHSVETKIKENRQWLQTTLTSIGDGVIATDVKGCVKFMNPVAETLTGWSQEDAMGLPLVDIFHIVNEQSREIVENPVQKVIETGQIVGLANHTVLISRDGREIPIKDSGAPILLDNDQLKGVVLVFQDDTEARAAENLLRQANERLLLAMESADEGSWGIDEKTRQMHFDPLCFKILGFDSPITDNPHQWWLNRIHQEDRQQVENWLEEITHTVKGQFNLDYRIADKDDNYLWLNSRANIIHADDYNTNSNLIIGIVRNITERKKEQQEKELLEAQLRQAQKVEAVGTLAGGIAHDFNNILASIIGFTELSLDETEKGSMLHENLCDILASGMRARDLVRQILMFSRHIECEFEDLNLNTLVTESLKMMRATIPTYIDIVEDVSDLPITILGNATQINQILVNLCTNGFHAISNTSGQLTIQLDTVTLADGTRTHLADIPPGSYARLTVEDSGKGIPPELIDKIFDPYFTTKDQDKGTGLGLSIVHGIVKAHSGNILVDSQQGEGTTFSVFLPLADQTTSDTKESPPTELPGGDEQILYVDDEPSIVKMGKQSLERKGYKVETKTSATEALNAVKAEPMKYDLVITDMAMPQMAGDELASSIKQIRPEIRVILCTGYSEKIDPVRAQELNLDRYLIKPVEQEKMLTAIREVLDLT